MFRRSPRILQTWGYAYSKCERGNRATLQAKQIARFDLVQGKWNLPRS